MWETWVRSLGQEDPLGRKWQPTPVFLPRKFDGQRSLVGYSPWDRKESDTTERLHFSFFLEDRAEFYFSPLDSPRGQEGGSILGAGGVWGGVGSGGPPMLKAVTWKRAGPLLLKFKKVGPRWYPRERFLSSQFSASSIIPCPALGVDILLLWLSLWGG